MPVVDRDQAAVDEHVFDDAKDFLEALADIGYGQSLRTNVPIYRGIGDADAHKLIPTVLRPDSADLVEKLCTTSDVPPGGEFALRHAELSILSRFYERAGRSGLALPAPALSPRADRSVQLAHGLLEAVGRIEEDWLSPGFLELAALAQHYGLPTRLLDWTTDPMVAAFFAAHSAADRRHRANLDMKALAAALRADVCVWMLNVKSITSAECPVEIVYPPYAGNPNLRAQQGVLTHWRSTEAIDETTPVDREPLEGKIAAWNANQADQSLPVEIVRYRLKGNHALRLCKLLDHRGYHHARLFPGYEGAAQAVRVYGRDRLTAQRVQDHKDELEYELIPFAIREALDTATSIEDQPEDDWTST